MTDRKLLLRQLRRLQGLLRQARDARARADRVARELSCVPEELVALEEHQADGPRIVADSRCSGVPSVGGVTLSQASEEARAAAKERDAARQRARARREEARRRAKLEAKRLTYLAFKAKAEALEADPG